MTDAISNRGLTRVLVAVLALAIGVAAAVLPARPAAAGEVPGAGVLLRGELDCWEEFDEKGRLITTCIYLPDLYRPDLPPPPCPVCEVLAFGFPERVTEDQQVLVLDSLAAGLGLLAKADQASEPEQVKLLRAEAMDQFADAAGALDPDGDPIKPVTGLLTVDSGELEPARVPWLAAAGADLVAGLELLAASDPDGDPVVPFDRAYQTLTGRHYR